MSKRLMLLFVISVLVLDVFVFDRISLKGIRPDSGVIILVFLSLSLQPVLAMVAGFLIGLSQVGTMTNAIPTTPLAMTLVGYLISKLGSGILHESLIVRMVAIIISSILIDLINLAWLDSASLVHNLFRYGVGSAVYSGVVGVGLMILLTLFVQSSRV